MRCTLSHPCWSWCVLCVGWFLLPLEGCRPTDPSPLAGHPPSSPISGCTGCTGRVMMAPFLYYFLVSHCDRVHYMLYSASNFLAQLCRAL